MIEWRLVALGAIVNPQAAKCHGFCLNGFDKNRSSSRRSTTL
jgi:hypothetical protein